MRGVPVAPMEDDGIEFLVLGGEAAIRHAGFAGFVASRIASGARPFWPSPVPSAIAPRS